MDIARLQGADDAAMLESCFHLVQECVRADQPADQPEWSLAAFTAKWVDGLDISPHESWTGVDASGAVVGCYLLTLHGQPNLSRASVELRVAPGRRRAGAGTALLRHCAGRARLADRTMLAGTAWDGSAGAAFAGAMGAAAGIADVHRTLVLDDAVRARLPQLRREAEARAAGYSLLSWTGPAPEDLLGDVAAVRAAMADAPRDAGFEPRQWDADRVRHREELLLRRGIGSCTVGARHDATGELAAITHLLTDPGAPGCGLQQVTAVLSAHRGRRLGLLVKVAMLELLTSSAPSITRIVTDNADANEHMIAINDQLGFEVSGVTRNWQLDLAGFSEA